ncbi:MAG: RiPP maturation radical SAM protein 1 [bacterium]|nr:RiPP maturation radical SAM protein 1 [bacterium]
MTEKEDGAMGPILIEGSLQPADVLLVASPLAFARVPSLGLHLLQAGCLQAGITAKVFYSNLPYLNVIGEKNHQDISLDYQYLLGERLFALPAFDTDSVSIKNVIHRFSLPTGVPDHVWPLGQGEGTGELPRLVTAYGEWVRDLDLQALEAQTDKWLRALAAEIVETGFPVVGCSTTFGGLIPALALLSCVKRADPNVTTILGGALCEGEMAEGIVSLDAGVDYVFSGEGDITFPILAQRILSDSPPQEKIVHGEDVTDMDALPDLDYSDYSQQREHYTANKYSFSLPFETSRGCWYGKCHFCGLNGKKNLFRKKSAENVIACLKRFLQDHDTKSLLMSDTMMPFQYFRTLLPKITEQLPPVDIVYEMRADLSLEQVLALRKAGVIFRPGVESLSSALLNLMNKPYTSRGNIALLRYARSAAMKVEWAFLVGFPGDETTQYREIVNLLPLIHHLEPPSVMYPLIIFRFSKYYMDPGAFGITNMKPAAVFRDILPEHADLEKIAYYYTAQFPSMSRDNPEVVDALWRAWKEWESAWASYAALPVDALLPTLHVTRKDDGRYILEDSRGVPGLPATRELSHRQARTVLVACPVSDADCNENVQWAVREKLGVVLDSWFVPLATADPELILEFEGEGNG